MPILNTTMMIKWRKLEAEIKTMPLAQKKEIFATIATSMEVAPPVADDSLKLRIWNNAIGCVLYNVALSKSNNAAVKGCKVKEWSPTYEEEDLY